MVSQLGKPPSNIQTSFKQKQKDQYVQYQQAELKRKRKSMMTKNPNGQIQSNEFEGISEEFKLR